MHFYEYKGFTIYPTPRLSLESDSWIISLTIRLGNKVKSFSAANSFNTKGEAAFHSIGYGKRIIDGEIEGHTIDDLL